MSDSNTATPLQQEITAQIETHTNRSARGTASAHLRGDEAAIMNAWFTIATEGKRPTVAALSAKTGISEKLVTAALMKPHVQQMMENTGHGVIDVVQLAVALRVAEALEDYTQKWQSGEIPFSAIPKPFQELAMEAYKSKIPETRAKMGAAKGAKSDGKPPIEFSEEALRLLKPT